MIMMTVILTAVVPCEWHTHLTCQIGGKKDWRDSEARKSDREPAAEKHPELAGQGGSPSAVSNGGEYETPNESSEQGTGQRNREE